MAERKTIQINPAFLSTYGAKNTTLKIDGFLFFSL